MCHLVVFFRSRDTAATMNDARSAGVLGPDDAVVVFTCAGDELAEPGDVVPGWGDRLGIPLQGVKKLTVVVPEGTTAQLVPLVFRLGRLEGIAASEAQRDWELDREPAPSTRMEIIDLQRGASPIVLVGGSLDSRSDL